MLAGLVMSGKPGAADAHDAGRAWPCGEKPAAADAHDAGLHWPCGENQEQLMSMMLAGFGNVGKPGEADAHDAGQAWLYEQGAADAHDAGRVWPCGENQGQLMLMMLAGFGHVGKTRGS